MNLWNLRFEEPARTFRNEEDRIFAELAAGIIEQAVLDWKDLDYGKLTRCPGKRDSTYIYAYEVESFFKSKWFEHLLSFALPQHTPQEIRLALKIKEPRRKQNARRTNRTRN